MMGNLKRSGKTDNIHRKLKLEQLNKKPDYPDILPTVDVDLLVSQIRGLTDEQKQLVGEFVDTLRRADPSGLGAAPELYTDRADKSENAPSFIERVYGTRGYLDGSFTRADLRRLDPKAYAALNNWEQHRGERADLNLPTKASAMDARVARLSPDAARVASSTHNRLRLAISRRIE